jgi:hypothetical protein
MDRLEEIRQRTEAGGPIRRIDMKYLLSEVGRLNALHKREIIITGEYAQRVIDLTARAEAAEADLRKCAPCWLCKKKCGIFDALDQRKDGCCPNFEWRGPQAGTVKGEAE